MDDSIFKWIKELLKQTLRVRVDLNSRVIAFEGFAPNRLGFTNPGVLECCSNLGSVDLNLNLRLSLPQTRT